MDVLIFDVEGHRYALPTSSVTEVVRAVTITALPGAPRLVEGVIDVRGALIPVIDVRMRFGLPARPVLPSDLLIIADSGSRRVALRSGRDAAVRRLHADDIDNSDDAFARSPFVAGIAKLPDGIVIIHDLPAFLSEAESAALESALQPPSPRERI